MEASDYTDYTRNPSSARVHEHETMLAFRNDIGNYAFNDWWNVVGEKSFKAWVSEFLSALNEEYS